jgi:ubiquinol-cytochrome c reductase iron-sulfur subunit
MSRLRDYVVSGLVFAVGRRRRRPQKDAARIVPEHESRLGPEIAVLLLLGLSVLGALAFILEYAFAAHLPATTQLYGASLGVSLLALAAAMIVVGLKLVANEEIVEEYPPPEHPGEQEAIGEVVEESGTTFTRSKLFKLGLLGAGGTLGLAFITPAVSMGPVFEVREYLGVPWKRGRRLVDDKGKPYRASDVEEDMFYTAFPEGLSEAAKEGEGAPVVLVRLPESALRLPEHLKDYPADGGVLAYSKICTHAGCAISMYRAPLFQPVEPRPALVCPCHYSTFDPANGGRVLFGPAGRDLPMLPIYADGDGYLRAAGLFDEPVGPSWWGVRLYKQFTSR